MTFHPVYKRREFLKVSAVAGGGLLVSLFLSSCMDATDETLISTPYAEPTTTPDPEAIFEPGVFVKVAGTGEVTLTIHRPDIGQGVRTAFAMILADELGADWQSIRIEQAQADPRYRNQVTGGSLGVSESYSLLRQAGAAARMVLTSAAAETWGVPDSECLVQSGFITHTPSGKRLSFADVVQKAADLPVPRSGDLVYKERDTFELIGTSPAPFDHLNMVSGKAIYASDISLPGMLYAVLARCPVPRGVLVDYDASAAESIDGVRMVLPVADGVAVVGDSSWAVIKGRRALNITWDEGSFADLNTGGIRERLYERIVPEDWVEGEDLEGEISAVYEVPFYAHATQEPPCCIVHVEGEQCNIWAPTQVPMQVLSRATSLTRLPRENIKVHIPLIGGGFGRRLQVDFIDEAISLALAVDAPVKLIWTREDDLRHDFYHPFNLHYVQASLDNPGLPTIRSASYERIPTGAWRAVTNVNEAFVRESFLDEIAVAIGRDPLELRLDVEPQQLLPVLDLVAEKSDWGSSLPEGWGRGIACHSTWNATPVAQVAEVSVSDRGEVRVHRVICAIDPGLIIHPELVKAQMEGGIVFGLTATLKDAITYEAGRVQQSNFHDYPLLRIHEMPKIEVHLMESGGNPSGVGEMGVPPIAPAVCNAIFDAIGVRVRRLPVRAEDLVGS